MNRLFGMLRYNKQWLVVFIVFAVEICFAVMVGIFDIVQLLILKNNAAKLSPAFVPLNIILAALVGLSLILMIIMFIIKTVKGNKNESKKG